MSTSQEKSGFYSCGLGAIWPHAVRHIRTLQDGTAKRRVLSALDTAFKLRGSYAPRDRKEAEQFDVKVIVMDMRRPPKLPAAIDVGGNGKPPADTNGHD